MELAELSHKVELFVAKRDERLAADKEARRLKAQEDSLAEELISEMRRNETYFCAGTTHRVKLNPSTRYRVADWPAYYQYMLDHEAMDLLQKRIHESALNDRLEDGEQIPGLEQVEVVKLSIGKI